MTPLKSTRRPRLVGCIKRLALVAALAMSAACGGIVIEPANGDQINSNFTRFRGYAVSPGASVDVEVRNSSNQFVRVGSGTASQSPTYIEGNVGYGFSFNLSTATLRANAGSDPAVVRVLHRGGSALTMLRTKHPSRDYDSAVDAWHDMKMGDREPISITLRGGSTFPMPVPPRRRSITCSDAEECADAPALGDLQ